VIVNVNSRIVQNNLSKASPDVKSSGSCNTLSYSMINAAYTKSIVIATQNRGKLREFKNMLSWLPVRLLSLSDFPNVVEVDEVGSSFVENAVLKAQGYAAQTGLIALADDSGLEVNALGGAPGVYSARYAGSTASDELRVEKLLHELSLTGDTERRARFVCVIAIFDQTTGNTITFDGICEGHIARAPYGENGFGYDPIFVSDGYNDTFAGLSTEIKQQISHRSRALKAATAYLAQLVSDRA
jgi:XTP/dITP diphosphohydrolase